MNVIIYYILLLSCWTYAMFRGGAPERSGATILLIGSLLTNVAFSAPAEHFKSMEVGVFFVDIVTLAAFLVLALRAERYWPLWVAALQVLGTAEHVVKLADPELLWRAYAFILAIWSYPMLVLFVVGTYRHQQRLLRFGHDRSWSRFQR